MSVAQKQLEPTDIQQSVRRARRAAHILAAISGERRDEALLAAAKAIEARSAEILAANEKDCAASSAEKCRAPCLRVCGRRNAESWKWPSVCATSRGCRTLCIAASPPRNL